MIWTLRIECVTGSNLEGEWVRLVEMDSASTLFDLHELIQDVVRFDRDHPFEFYAGRNYRHRAVSFDDSEDLDAADPTDDLSCREDQTLEQVFPLPKNLKLYYHFDFGDDWRFEVRRMRNKPKQPEPRVKYPRVIEATGRNPRQYGRY